VQRGLYILTFSLIHKQATIRQQVTPRFFLKRVYVLHHQFGLSFSLYHFLSYIDWQQIGTRIPVIKLTQIPAMHRWRGPSRVLCTSICSINKEIYLSKNMASFSKEHPLLMGDSRNRIQFLAPLNNSRSSVMYCKLADGVQLAIWCSSIINGTICCC
jgi:hypothetical protein